MRLVWPARQLPGRCQRVPYRMTCLFVVVSVCTVLFAFVAGVGHADTLDGFVRQPATDDAQGDKGGHDSRHKCAANDVICEKDLIGFEAIAHLHSQIDDDHNGSLDRAESDEFIREDLKYQDGRLVHSRLHGVDDFITVQELWHVWVTSTVYNWTVEDVVSWLVHVVELPQYADSFRVNEIDGHVLPRLASNSQTITMMLGIKNSVHKQKLSVKAADLVLFGPPKGRHSYLIDAAVAVLLLISAIGCWLTLKIRHSADRQTQKLMKDLVSLQAAEDSLSSLQKRVKEAKMEHIRAASDRRNLEKKVQLEFDNVKGEEERLKHQHMSAEEQQSELRKVEQELTRLRGELSKVEHQITENCSLPAVLQPWLQLTYEIENQYFETKRKTAEDQLKAAKDMCERLRVQKGQFFSAVRIAHTTSLDDTDQTIFTVKCSLEEVRRQLKERVQRWQDIERICGFAVGNNPGVSCLRNILGLGSPHSDENSHSDLNLDLDMADDDMPAPCVVSQVMSAVATSGDADSNHRQSVPVLRSQNFRPDIQDSVMGRHSPVLRPALRSQALSVSPLTSTQDGDDLQVQDMPSPSSSERCSVTFDIDDDMSPEEPCAYSSPSQLRPPSPTTNLSFSSMRSRSTTVPSLLSDSSRVFPASSSVSTSVGYTGPAVRRVATVSKALDPSICQSLETDSLLKSAASLSELCKQNRKKSSSSSSGSAKEDTKLPTGSGSDGKDKKKKKGVFRIFKGPSSKPKNL